MINVKVLPEKAGVYSLTNTRTGQRYIGYSVNINRRINEHINRMDGNYQGYLNPKLLNAWRCDKQFFIAEVIELTLDKTREEYWTRYYKSYISGYNFSIGTRIGEHCKKLQRGKPKTLGFTGRTHTQASINKMIQSRTGLKRSTATRQKQSDSAKTAWKSRSKDKARIRIQGEKNPSSKLTENDVRGIRYLHSRGYTYKKLSIMYNVSLNHIGEIVRHEKWKQVK